MEKKQTSREVELLEQIKFCLLVKNESQALRLIIKFAYKQKEINIIESHQIICKCKDNQ